MLDKLYIVMPAYNEEANIVHTLEEWYPVIEKYNENGESRLIVVDDGSKDNTLKLLQGYAQTHPLLIPLTKSNSGHGPTVMFAYQYALKNGATWIFQTDSDGQTNPKEFEEFWNNRKQFDAILGYRKHRGDGIFRKFVEKVVCLLIRFYFGVKVLDANAPFRLMRAEKVKEYVSKLRDDFNIPNIMMTTYFVYYHDKVSFREISFRPRVNGKNSINIKKIIKIGKNAMKDFKMLKKEMEV
ncbi:MAG: glycosyltransferase family 2 protein [Clostridia bacterium]|nr:glycosyltransferase family 2 protein [Clostridia bacterium]